MDPTSIIPLQAARGLLRARRRRLALRHEGRRYLDALAGIAVCGLGHGAPRFTRAIQEQAAAPAAHVQRLRHHAPARSSPTAWSR